MQGGIFFAATTRKGHVATLRLRLLLLLPLVVATVAAATMAKKKVAKGDLFEHGYQLNNNRSSSQVKTAKKQRNRKRQ